MHPPTVKATISAHVRDLGRLMHPVFGTRRRARLAWVRTRR